MPAPRPAQRTHRHHRLPRGAAILVPLLVALIAAVAGAAGAEPVPEPPPGVAITLNGAPMDESAEGKLAGCTLDIGVSGLDPETLPSSVGVVVRAVAPTTPEGSPATLVDEDHEVDDTTFTRTIAMDDLLAPFPVKPNGYHLRVLVSIDGTLAATGVYWLACGSDQDGTPTRILVEARWVMTDGTESMAAPTAELPPGWRATLLVDAASRLGAATCTVADGDDVLTCAYDNPGHGDEPGLVVPGSPTATYQVTATGTPAGWTVDEATVGEFVGRETCLRDEHETDVATTAADEGPHVCTHVVRLIQDEVPPTTTTTIASTTSSPPTTATATTAAPTTAEPGVAAAAVTTAATSGPLPATGANPALAVLGAVLITGGLLLLASGRRARAGTDRT